MKISKAIFTLKNIQLQIYKKTLAIEIKEITQFINPCIKDKLCATQILTI